MGLINLALTYSTKICPPVLYTNAIIVFAIGLLFAIQYVKKKLLCYLCIEYLDLFVCFF